MVRPWLITMENRRRFEVLAPTRYLERLNLSHYADEYTPISRIGIARVPQSDGRSMGFERGRNEKA